MQILDLLGMCFDAVAVFTIFRLALAILWGSDLLVFLLYQEKDFCCSFSDQS